jgi:hypothetical protein
MPLNRKECIFNVLALTVKSHLFAITIFSGFCAARPRCRANDCIIDDLAVAELSPNSRQSEKSENN